MVTDPAGALELAQRLARRVAPMLVDLSGYLDRSGDTVAARRWAKRAEQLVAFAGEATSPGTPATMQTTRDMGAWQVLAAWLEQDPERSARITTGGRFFSLHDAAHEVAEIIRPGESPWTTAGRALVAWGRR
jgi:hypothetical protein